MMGATMQCLKSEGDFAASLIEGLSQPRKTLPCRFLYDARGSELFEQITELPEYYLARCEMEILEGKASEIAAGRSNGGVLIEFGAGSSRKTEILLRHMPGLAAYVPIDVSLSILESAKDRLEKRFPSLDVRPLAGDFANGVSFPVDFLHYRKVGFFPGSTIGNFTPTEVVRLLRAMRLALSPDGVLIVGVDLKKEVSKLLRAYNDAQGVTAEFNLNLLQRANRELDADFDISAFQHEAIYNPVEGRIEMHLVSVKDQRVRAAGRCFSFSAKERVHTENSYKYTVEQFRQTARLAGWTLGRVWMDESLSFSVHELLAGPRASTS